MWEASNGLIWTIWPYLLVAAIVVVSFVSIIGAGCLEKNRIHDYEPTDKEALRSTSPYFSAMNDAARQLGFQLDGVFAQSRNSRTYRCGIALWLSVDLNSLLLVAGGKIAGANYRKTFLLSRVSEDKALVTIDNFGTEDLSGLWSVEVLINADLPELNARHQQRLASCGFPPISFSSADLLQQYQSLNRARADRMNTLGLAKYVDPGREIWRYTLKGACTYAFRGYLLGLKRAQSQSGRLKKKRPGS